VLGAWCVGGVRTGAGHERESRHAVGGSGVDRVVQSVAATGCRRGSGIGSRHRPARRTCGGNGSRVLLAAVGFYVLARMEAGEIVRLRSFTPECEIDAGGLPLVWLTDLKPADGVAWLVQMYAPRGHQHQNGDVGSPIGRSSATKFFDELYGK
jgi:hypothetical protein